MYLYSVSYFKGVIFGCLKVSVNEFKQEVVSLTNKVNFVKNPVCNDR